MAFTSDRQKRADASFNLERQITPSLPRQRLDVSAPVPTRWVAPKWLGNPVCLGPDANADTPLNKKRANTMENLYLVEIAAGG